MNGLEVVIDHSSVSFSNAARIIKEYCAAHNVQTIYMEPTSYSAYVQKILGKAYNFEPVDNNTKEHFLGIYTRYSSYEFIESINKKKGIVSSCKYSTMANGHTSNGELLLNLETYDWNT